MRSLGVPPHEVGPWERWSQAPSLPPTAFGQLSGPTVVSDFLVESLSSTHARAADHQDSIEQEMGYWWLLLSKLPNVVCRYQYQAFRTRPCGLIQANILVSVSVILILVFSCSFGETVTWMGGVAAAGVIPSSDSQKCNLSDLNGHQDPP